MVPRKLSFRPNRTDAHMNSQRLWHHADSVYRSKPDGLLALRGRSGHELPSPRSYLQFTTAHKGKIGFLLWNLPGYTNHT